MSMEIMIEDLCARIEEAVAGAREQPEKEPGDVVGAVIARAQEDALLKTSGAAHSEFRQRAVELLRIASDDAEEMGEHPDAPLIRAVAGAGFALLANGIDAECFYSEFSGPGGQALVQTRPG